MNKTLSDKFTLKDYFNTNNVTNFNSIRRASERSEEYQHVYSLPSFWHVHSPS
jgi:hypothetical protein